MLGPASAVWNDYLGTAAADDADAVRDARSLYELAGLDRDRWTIVSIDLDRCEAAQRVTVYAVDRQRLDGHPQPRLQQIVEAGGELPVTAFHLLDARRVDDFTKEAFKRVVIRLSCRAVADTTLSIEGEEQLSDRVPPIISSG